MERVFYKATTDGTPITVDLMAITAVMEDDAREVRDGYSRGVRCYIMLGSYRLPIDEPYHIVLDLWQRLRAPAMPELGESEDNLTDMRHQHILRAARIYELEYARRQRPIEDVQFQTIINCRIDAIREGKA